jgi:hypothetical protein
MQLSKNFSLHELTKSETAIRLGIDNTPPANVKNNLQALVINILQPVRDAHGLVKVTSGYRSQSLNIKIGGSGNSDHCKGFAADFEVPGLDNKELAKWIEKNLKFTQLILEFYVDGVPDSGWVHCSYNPSNLKQQVLTAKKQKGRTVYFNGLV